jgi:hypothetical protein
VPEGRPRLPEFLGWAEVLDGLYVSWFRYARVVDFSLTLIPLVVVLVWAAISGASSTSAALRRKLLREFRLVAEEMDLQCELEEGGDQIVLRGRRADIEVEGRVRLKGNGTGIVSARPAGLSPAIRLLDPVGPQTHLGSDHFAGYRSGDAFEDIKIGDPHFDALIVVRGPLPDLYAALTESARSALTTLIAHDGFLITDGQLQIQLTERDGAWMRRNFSSLLRAARQLVMDETRASRFLGNYRAEMNPTIALRNAVYLLGEEAGSPEAAIITELLIDEGAQRFSASGLCPEWPGLLATVLMRRPDRALSVVDELLDATLLDEPKNAPLGLSKIVLALGTLDATLVGPLIWKMLDSDLPTPVRLIASNSMGRVGTVGDVGRLRALPVGVFDKELQAAIDRAVDLIQGRLGGVGGGLALTGDSDEAGGLSAAVEEGALSDVERESEG